MSRGIVKAVAWQALCLAYSLSMGRLWFGEWSVSAFSIFLCGSLVPIFYVYEKAWGKKK
jgi:hypothetical protein